MGDPRTDHEATEPSAEEDDTELAHVPMLFYPVSGKPVEVHHPKD